MDVHALGRLLLAVALVVSVFVAQASVLGQRRQDGRLLLAGERAAIALTFLLISASLLLVHAFVTHDFTNRYVARYSDTQMPWFYLVAAFWGGQEGSLLLWSLILAICTGLVVIQGRESHRELVPTVLTVLALVQAFFLGLMVFDANPFAVFRIEDAPLDGRGLEPLLQNPAMTFHPPSILSGYVWFTVPFAFAIAALVHGRLDTAWMKATRRYALVSWGFLSMGNLFGGMWAYEELGWGGFWGWDPVENASLMPWLTATAYLHSVMIQERRGMLKIWNISLVLLTYFLTIFGTFLTRSGLIDSVHTFAQSDIGGYFMVFLGIIAVVSVGLTIWRIMDGSLKSASTVDSFVSREGVFLFNNLVLVACTAVVMFGTLGEKISAYLWKQTKYTAPWFNSWMVPLGLILLLLMAIGPLIPWRKTSWSAFTKNFAMPVAVGLVVTSALVSLDVHNLWTHLKATSIPWSEVPLARLPLESRLAGVYATLGFFGVFVMVYSLLVEFVRGARVRARSTKEGFFTALFNLTSKNRRRYGGYLTHLGFAGLFLGFVGTGLKTDRDLAFTAPGQSAELEDTVLVFKGLESRETPAFNETFAVFDIHQSQGGQPGKLLGTLKPSQRRYTSANVRMSRVTTEKDELFRFGGNVYLSLVSHRPGLGSAEIVAHFNPLILWMWVGGGVLLLGIGVALWPEQKRFQVLAAAQKAVSGREVEA